MKPKLSQSLLNRLALLRANASEKEARVAALEKELDDEYLEMTEAAEDLLRAKGLEPGRAYPVVVDGDPGVLIVQVPDSVVVEFYFLEQ